MKAKRKSPRSERSNSTPAPKVVQHKPPDNDFLNSRVVLVLLFLVVLVTAIYGRVVHYDFIAYDDPIYVVDNPQVSAGMTLQGILWAFTTADAANWHPLTWLSHMLDVQLYGVNAGPHHLTNVLLHAVNCCLLFGCLFSMTGSLGRSAFVAGLFAAHPLNVESVAWVAERKNVLSTLLGLLTLWAYVRYVRRPDRKRYGVVVLLFALGLMAKPMLVTLPLLLMLLDWWPLQRITQPVFAEQQRPILRKVAWEKVPFVALALASSAITVFAQHKGGAVRTFKEIPFFPRLFNAVVAYVGYLLKTFWPTRLGVFYPFPASIPAWKVAGSTLLLLSITLLVCRSASRRQYLATGWFWYLGSLVPVIGLVQVGNQSMADRYGYVPLIGIFIIVAWGIPELVSRWRPAPVVLATAAVCVVCTCAVASTNQLQYWKENFPLWKHTVEVTEDSRFAQVYIGNALLAQGKQDEAVAHYSEALRLEPDFDMALDNMGIVLLNQGKVRDAFPYLVKAVQVSPSFAHAHNDLGVALEREGRMDEAIAQYSEAVRLDSDLEVAHVNLAKLFATRGRVDEAIHEYLEALRLKSDDPTPHYDLGIIFNSKGDIPRAISEFATAVKLKPGYAEAERALNILSNSASRP